MTIENLTSASAALLFRANEASGIHLEGGKKELDRPEGRRIEDRLDISDRARDADKLRDPLPPLSAILGSFKEALATFGDELGKRFLAAGIDTSQPIELRVDADGRVRVTNDHPDKDKIGAIFAKDPEFANRFRGLTAAAEIRTAVRDHEKFAEVYKEDPQAALARLTQLFVDRQSAEVRFQYSGAELTVSYADKDSAFEERVNES